METQSSPSLPLKVPRSLAVAALLVSGIWIGDALSCTAVTAMFGSSLVLSLMLVAARQHWRTVENVGLTLSMIGLGASLWAVHRSTENGLDIGQLVEDEHIRSDSPVTLTGIVSNIPALDTTAAAASLTASRLQPPRTLFLLKTTSLRFEPAPVSVHGMCRVIVDGDATKRIQWGDSVEMTGVVDRAKPPMNPGEFDFARHLQRNRISAMMFIKHPAATKVLSAGRWHPRALLTSFRQQTVFMLQTHLSPKNRATAEALLLGNRGHLAPDLERDFVTSGTMHLLAISGLHVGILYVFLVRLLNVLLVPRTRALILAGSVCVLYCLLTDLRPSVLRATVFIVLQIFGQVVCREQKMGALIGTTTLLLVVADPSIAFDVGAWLSFLAVGALGWVSEHSPTRPDRPVPLEVLSWSDRLRDFRSTVHENLSLSYRQMIAVTLLSAPLVATQFHMVSVTGMVINVLLIPLTSLTLIAGYVFIAIGLTIPPIGIVPGFVFGVCLSALNTAVSFSADFRPGYITIPDLPAWFLPLYYVLLAVSAVASQTVVRQCFRLALLTLVAVSLWLARCPPTADGLVCTVLSVGHGNAVVVETPNGKVLLFDAGALNRGDRTADLVSRFLWLKGYRMIDAIVISHPDMDHYNAVAGLLERMPVGQLMITSEFAQSEVAEVHRVLETAASFNIDCTVVRNGDSILLDALTVNFLQADLSDSQHKADNATSLVAILNFDGCKICLPGDLEGEGQQLLLPSLPTCNLLVSPHHGSLAANPRSLATQLQAGSVVVSSRDTKLSDSLKTVFAESDVLLTSHVGAVSYHIRPNGRSSVTPFVRIPSAP
ncbi:MAG: DNA internalization-related competence protein ComEC/Rec2 [Planctomycetota bacterium]|nr:MAG: DNA internalization-related competence protein ComEC/Rec2 [Planctomycetota bacterium]